MNDVIAAWEAWDRYPGAEAQAKLLVQAVHDYAGTEANELRKHMSAALRDGLTRVQALTEWELLHG